MFKYKIIVLLIVLCVVSGSLSKPFENNVNEGRGIGSTIWAWISYPFSWWSADVNEIPPENDQLTGFSPINSYENIEVGKRNVTIWCNDQTCTTMRCDNFGCVNVTCNIYDTDLYGECRNYNTGIKPEEPTSNITSLEPTNDKEPEVIKPTITPATPVSSTSEVSTTVEERPLELEAVLSSTVTEQPDKEENSES